MNTIMRNLNLDVLGFKQVDCVPFSQFDYILLLFATLFDGFAAVVYIEHVNTL